MGFVGWKKSIHNLLTEGFSACVCAGRYLLYHPLTRRVYHNAVLLNDLLCVQSQHPNTHFSHRRSLALSKSERAGQRIYKRTVELLDLQAGAVIPGRCKEAISEPFKGWDGDILHNTLGCPVQRGQYLIKSSQIQCFFFFWFSVPQYFCQEAIYH